MAVAYIQFHSDVPSQEDGERGYGGTRFLFRKKESCKEKPFDVRILLSLFAFARGVTGWCFLGLFIFYVLAALIFAYPVMSQRLFSL